MIELEHIGKRFGDVEAVKSISLAVAKGEFLSLLGPSGCGKTTTLRIIAGFEYPSSGQLRIAGRDMTRVPVEKRGLSMVFQNYALFPHLTVFENVAFGLRLKQIPKHEVEERVGKALDLVGLRGYGDRAPRQLSGGQQQRVSLARGLVVNPSVLLMDEPLSNLDLKLREQLRDEIRSLQRKLGITAVYVTHDQGEAMAMSDRIAVMHAGRIEQIGQPREVYERPQTTFVASFIGHCNLLRGKAEGPGTFRTAKGLRLRIPADAGVERGESRLAIRPEALEFDRPETNSAPSDWNRLTGRVTDVVYLGDVAHVSVVLTGNDGGEAETINATWRIARGQSIPVVGDTVHLLAPVADCVPVADGAA